MPYRIVEIELSEPPRPFTLGAGDDGFALIARWRDRLAGFHMASATPGSSLSTEALTALCAKHFSRQALTIEAEGDLLRRWSDDRQPAPPPLTIAICTKDRAKRLAGLLESLQRVTAASRFRATEILVIDNASVDSATREAVAGFAGMRYTFEPRAGLDFARNAALRHATGDLLAFLDDDVVVDRHWLDGLYCAWEGCPEAGGFTGL